MSRCRESLTAVAKLVTFTCLRFEGSPLDSLVERQVKLAQ